MFNDDEIEELMRRYGLYFKLYYNTYKDKLDKLFKKEAEMQEKFVGIGFKDYSISNKGNVRNEKTGRILKTFVNSCGYVQINLGIGDDGKQYVPLIHRLVAENFVLNNNNYTVVNHKDENKQNNSADNLEWCTDLYNVNYGTRNQRAAHGLKGNQNAKNKKKSITPCRYIYIYNGKEYDIATLSEELKCSKSKITEAFRMNYGLVRLGLLTRKIKEKK